MRMRAAIVVVLTSGLALHAVARDGGDDQFTALSIGALPFTDDGSNRSNENAFDHECAGVPAEYDGKDQWYSLVATQAMTVRVSTCSPSFIRICPLRIIAALRCRAAARRDRSSPSRRRAARW